MQNTPLEDEIGDKAARELLNSEKTLARSVAFKAGMEAKRMKTPLKKSAIQSLMTGSKQYFDFLDGYDFKEAL